MASERAPLFSRLSLLLALVAVVLATTWALRTPPHPNSDRYDYLGRAWHLTRGQGPSPMVVYPLRLNYPGAGQLPAENLTRPPLWPAVLSLPMRLGSGEHSAVIASALCLLALAVLLERATPGRFGGFAALTLAGGFATWRALQGGGPELALALLLAAVWTWSGSPRPATRVVVLSILLGLMPWLHPVGWVYLFLGLGARLWRDPLRTILTVAPLAVLIGLPWYYHVGQSTGQFLGPLQAQAELAKSVHDGGGLGPYPTLEGVSSASVILDDPQLFLRHVAHNLKEQLRHLDAWMAWPLLLLGLWGIGHDRWLALRDLLLIGLGFVAISMVAFDPRLLVPLLPVAALWVGAGAMRMSSLGNTGMDHAAPSTLEQPGKWSGLLPVLVVLPWLVPLGLTPAPGTESGRIARELRDPPREAVLAYGQAGEPGTPCFTDSSVLAFRARRLGIAIPTEPAILEQLLDRPMVGKAPVLVASAGSESWWFRAPAWKSWWEGRAVTPLAGVAGGLVTTARTPRAPYIPEALSLGPDDAPDSLLTIGAPLAVRDGLQVTPPTLRSLLAMADAARADGVHLRVTSAYRSWQRQAELYERAQQKHGQAQRWVAAPGTSEHQLGSTVDFCDAAMQQVTEPGFAETREGRWLAEHAARHGWVRSYTEANEELSGYRPEAWHYRFGVISAEER